MNELTHEQLVEELSYNEKTGIFVRRSTGNVVGTKSKDGYLIICICGSTYNAQRLAVFYHTGTMPSSTQQVDHVMSDKEDARVSMLRVCSNSQNKHNISNTSSKSSNTGVKGITYLPKFDKYLARICVEGTKYSKRHVTLEEAKAYLMGIRMEACGDMNPFSI